MGGKRVESTSAPRLVATFLVHNLASHQPVLGTPLCALLPHSPTSGPLCSLSSCPSFLPGSSPLPQAADSTCLDTASFSSPSHAVSSSNSNLYAILGSSLLLLLWSLSGTPLAVLLLVLYLELKASLNRLPYRLEADHLVFTRTAGL